MDEFTPNPNYNPEDEYAPIEPQQAPQAQPEDALPQQDQPVYTHEEPEYAQPQQAQPVYPQEQPNYAQQAQPVYPQPVYPQQAQPVYPRPVYPQQAQPVYPQPVYPRQQPVYPQQQQAQPVYPQPVYTQQQPTYPQQPQAQVRQPANPYSQPAGPAYPRPAVQNQETAQKPPKQASSTGTKVFIICLVALLAAMIVGFGVYIWKSTGDSLDTVSDSIKQFTDNGGDKKDSDSLNGLEDLFGNNSGTNDYTEIDDTITLVPDNGETQKRDTDNSASVGTPDEKAPVLVLNPLPKDADSNKYTSKSAYDSVADSVVIVECFQDKITENDRDIVGSGSGTIISSDGYIITNAHVIGNSKTYLVQVILNNSKKYQATIVGFDTWTDLAVLKIDAKGLKPVTFGDSKLVNVGDDVIAIGSPGGEKFQNSLTKGIVSAVDREISINRYVRYIQSDAAISPGNSGGALCNIYGQVVGITTAKTIATHYENMSFSIPSDTVKQIVDDLMRYGYVKGRCRIGLSCVEVGSDEVMYYGYPSGIIISEIDPEGSLAESGIEEGDILVEIDSEEITCFQDVYDILADHNPGDKVSIKFIRYKDR